jgi:hypothetical protein
MTTAKVHPGRMLLILLKSLRVIPEGSAEYQDMMRLFRKTEAELRRLEDEEEAAR